MKVIYIFVLVLIPFMFSCNNRKSETSADDTLIGQSVLGVDDIDNVRQVDSVLRNNACPEVISKQEYDAMAVRFKPDKNDTLVKIVDENEILKKLDGHIILTEYVWEDRTITYPHKIKLRDGREIHLCGDQDCYPEFYLSAYFPTIDVLLLVGRHETELAFDLKTGEGIETLGNPDLNSTSADGLSRLISYYSGQESEFVYQKKAGDRYIDQFDLKNLLINCKFSFYYAVDSFWNDEGVFYFVIPSWDDEKENIYCKMKL